MSKVKGKFIEDNAIDSEKIKDGSIDTVDLKDGAVTMDKLSSTVQEAIEEVYTKDEIDAYSNLANASSNNLFSYESSKFETVDGEASVGNWTADVEFTLSNATGLVNTNCLEIYHNSQDVSGKSVYSGIIPLKIGIRKKRNLQLSLVYEVDGPSYVSGDLKVVVRGYNISQSAWEDVSGVTGDVDIRNVSFGEIKLILQDIDKYSQLEVRLYCETDSTPSAKYSVFVDEPILATLGTLMAGPVIKRLGDKYQVTGNWPAIYTTESWRIGNIFKARVRVSLTSDPTAFPVLTLTVPPELTIKMEDGAYLTSVVGSLVVQPVGTTIRNYGYLTRAGQNLRGQISRAFDGSDSTWVQNYDLLPTRPVNWSDGGFLLAEFEVPIAEWEDSSNTFDAAELELKTETLYPECLDVVSNGAQFNQIIAGVSPNPYFDYDPIVGQLICKRKCKYIATASLGYSDLSVNDAFRANLYSNSNNDRRSFSIRSYASSTAAADQRIGGLAISGEIEVGQYIRLGTTHGKATPATLEYCDLTIQILPDIQAAVALAAPFEIVSTSTSAKTPQATSHWHQLTGNNLDLTPGIWRLIPSKANFQASGGSASYSFIVTQWAGSNGNDTRTGPMTLQDVDGIEVLGVSHLNGRRSFDFNPNRISNASIATDEVVIKVTKPVTVYLCTYAQMDTPANARVAAFPNAVRIK